MGLRDGGRGGGSAVRSAARVCVRLHHLFIPPRLSEELVLVDGGIVIDLNVRGLQPPLVGRDERRDDFVEEHVGGRTSRDLRGATAVGGGLGGIRQPTLEIRRLAHRSAQHPTERARANGWARPHRANKNLLRVCESTKKREARKVFGCSGVRCTVFYLHGMGTGDVGTVLNYRYGNG